MQHTGLCCDSTYEEVHNGALAAPKTRTLAADFDVARECDDDEDDHYADEKSQ